MLALLIDKSFYDMSNIAGRVIIGPSHLLLKGVPIVAPAGGAAGAERGGEELLKSLDLRVEKGEHTLITGPKCVLRATLVDSLLMLPVAWGRLQSLESLQSFGRLGQGCWNVPSMEKAAFSSFRKGHTLASEV